MCSEKKIERLRKNNTHTYIHTHKRGERERENYLSVFISLLIAQDTTRSHGKYLISLAAREWPCSDNKMSIKVSREGSLHNLPGRLFFKLTCPSPFSI